jgi:hypothetical protein
MGAMGGAGKGTPGANGGTPALQPGAQISRTSGFPMAMPVNRASGGVMSSEGFGTDRIPSMLTAGEYVINKDTVDKMGVGFLDKLNENGEVDTSLIRRFKDGGLVESSPTGFSSPTTNPTQQNQNNNQESSNNNTINITINIDKSGDTSKEESQEAKSQSGSLEQGNQERTQKDMDQAKQLSKQIEAVVIDVIEKNSRPGGMLAKK